MCMKNADIYLNAMYTIPISFVRKYGRFAVRYAACMYHVVTCMHCKKTKRSQHQRTAPNNNEKRKKK